MSIRRAAVELDTQTGAWRWALRAAGMSLSALPFIGSYAIPAFALIEVPATHSSGSVIAAPGSRMENRPRYRMAEAKPSGHGGKKGDRGKSESEAEVLPPIQTEQEKSPAEQYCLNVQEAAAAAHLALQRKGLEQAKEDLEERIKELEAKTQDIKSYLKRREEFLKQANDGLIEIYAKMEPEAAAARLLIMNDMIAAAMLSKLSPKTAGAILAEMDTAKAARLSSLLAGVADLLPRSKPDTEGQR